MLHSGVGKHEQPVFAAYPITEIHVFQISRSLKPFIVLKGLSDLAAPHCYASREPIHLDVSPHRSDHALIARTKHRTTAKTINIEKRFHKYSARRALVYDVKSSSTYIAGSGFPKPQHGLDASVLQYKVVIKITCQGRIRRQSRNTGIALFRKRRRIDRHILQCNLRKFARQALDRRRTPVNDNDLVRQNSLTNDAAQHASKLKRPVQCRNHKRNLMSKTPAHFSTFAATAVDNNWGQPCFWSSAKRFTESTSGGIFRPMKRSALSELNDISEGRGAISECSWTEMGVIPSGSYPNSVARTRPNSYFETRSRPHT